MLLDAHCHIDLFQAPERLVAKVEAKGIFVLAVSNTPSMYRATARSTAHAPHILPCLGLHPSLGQELRPGLAAFKQLLGETAFVGEVGLDGTCPRDQLQTQEEVFDAVLEAVDPRKHLLSVHSRKRAEQCLRALKQAGVRRAIFHWYSGPLGLLDEIVAGGYYFSVNHAMCRSAAGRKRIAAIPLEKLLVESDGPFVKVAGEPTSPLQMASLIGEVADVLGLTPEEVGGHVSRNAKAILGLHHT